MSNNALEFLSGKLPVRDLTKEAAEGLLPRFIVSKHSGGDHVFRQIVKILYRRERRHVLVTGLRGIGKTATVVEVARRAAAGNPSFLKSHRFLWIDATHVGPEDSRSAVETILTASRDGGPTILCLDGVHSLIRRPNGLSNKPLLRAALEDQSLSVIGILPRWEYTELFASDADMVEIFNPVDISEPDEDQSIAIAMAAAERLAHEYSIDISADAVRRSVFLSSHFVLSECLPRKAIRILRQACDEISFSRSELCDSRSRVEDRDVISVTSQRTGIPESTLAGNAVAPDWEGALSRVVVGQPRAVACVANELRLIKAGLSHPAKPATVVLFAGMTGVGKTELAKCLAELYSSSKRLKNYSMANFTEGHSVSGIVGVPPGYVGHDQGGRLINDLNSDPYSVFLLDEAEKAHPNVWKPFLNLFDEGWIVDQRGVKASADRAVFVLTTNAGSEDVQQMSRDGRPIYEIEQRVTSILSRVRQERGAQPVFPPQFLARIKQIVVFQPLSRDAMVRIAAKLIRELQVRWQQRRDQELEVDDDVVEWLGHQANLVNEQSGGREGGRAVRKLIGNCVEGRLAQLAGQLADGAKLKTLRLRLSSDVNFDELLIRPAEQSPVRVE